LLSFMARIYRHLLLSMALAREPNFNILLKLISRWERLRQRAMSMKQLRFSVPSFITSSEREHSDTRRVSSIGQHPTENEER